MKFYMHQRIIGENLIKIGLILSAQWRFSEERYQACPVTLTLLDISKVVRVNRFAVISRYTVKLGH